MNSVKSKEKGPKSTRQRKHHVQRSWGRLCIQPVVLKHRGRGEDAKDEAEEGAWGTQAL